MAEANIPAAAIIGVVAGIEVQVGIDADVDDVPLSPAEDLHVAPVKPDPNDSSPATGKNGAILTLGLGESEIANGDVEPAVDTHANPVGRMIRSPALGLIGADAGDERLFAISDAVKISIVIDG